MSAILKAFTDAKIVGHTMLNQLEDWLYAWYTALQTEPMVDNDLSSKTSDLVNAISVQIDPIFNINVDQFCWIHLTHHEKSTLEEELVHEPEAETSVTTDDKLGGGATPGNFGIWDTFLPISGILMR